MTEINSLPQVGTAFAPEGFCSPEAFYTARVMAHEPAPFREFTAVATLR